MKFKKCPFCGYDGEMKISTQKEKRKVNGIYYTKVTVKCGGICTCNLSQCGYDSTDALIRVNRLWNKRSC